VLRNYGFLPTPTDKGNIRDLFLPDCRCQLTILSTTMSLLLLDSPVNAAVNSQLSINLLSRQRASVHAINKAVSVVDLPLTACFLGQGRSTVLSFVISEEDLGFEIILGSQWDLAFFQVSTS